MTSGVVFKIMNLTQLPSRHVGVGSWGVSEPERPCNHFGKDLNIDEKEFCALINANVTKREFFAYKVQTST